MRWGAAWSLGYIGDSQAIEPLHKRLEIEEVDDVREQIQEAIEKINEQMRNAPRLSISIESSGSLCVGEWDSLIVKIINDGQGPAKNVNISTFGPLDCSCEPISIIQGGNSLRSKLNVRPLELGREVPLSIHMTFEDDRDRKFESTNKILLEVANINEVKSRSKPSIIVHGNYEVIESGTR